MTNMVQLEYQRDEAKAKLDAIEAAESDCENVISTALRGLQDACGCSDKQRLFALSTIDGALAEMTESARNDLEREISSLDDSIGQLEWEDLERSRPVVL